jgi:hypothetical protein
MATIRARKQADGTVRYMAIVRLRKGKEVIHQETKTFSQCTAAEKWAKSREVALENPAALVKAKQAERSQSLLIRWYIDNFSSVSKWQRTKQAQLERFPSILQSLRQHAPRDSRPKTTAREVFIRASAPLQGFSKGSALHALVRRRIAAADVRPIGKRGPHVF